MPVSPDTLLRLVHRAEAPLPSTPRVLAVDDWAWRRGQNYGTILVDLERNRVVELLPDRETGTLSAWLRRHGGIEFVARDRAGAYADAVRQGAPDAMQVADRWHLLRNLGEALQGGVDRHRGAPSVRLRAPCRRKPPPQRNPCRRRLRARSACGQTGETAVGCATRRWCGCIGWVYPAMRSAVPLAVPLVRACPRSIAG